MLRIAVCDDELSSRVLLKEYCERFFAIYSVDQAVSVVYDAYSNALDILQAIDEGSSYDLIFFDIYMSGISGIEAATELRSFDSTTHVVFVTSSSDHAVDAFALHVDDYLVKPLEYSRFEECMRHCLSAIEKTKNSVLPFKTRAGLRKIEYRTIAYSETDNHFQILHLVTGETLSSRMSSSALYSQLEGDPRFFKAGSSFIINLDNIHAIEGRDVTFLGGESIQVPVRARAPLGDAYFANCFESGTSDA